MTPDAPAAPPASGQPPTPDGPPTPPPAAPAPTPPAPTPPPAPPPAEPPAPPKAPAAYDLKVPDTAKPLLSDKDLAYLKDIAKASDWSNDEAQAELDATITRAQQRIADQAEAWLSETKADTDYGGAKLEESQRLARAVVERLRPVGHPHREGFLRLLNTGGIGNHLEVVSFLADLGKLMAEDAPRLSGGLPDTASKTVEEKLYGAARGLRHAKE